MPEVGKEVDEDEWGQLFGLAGLTVDGEEGSEQRRTGSTLVECKQRLVRAAQK